MSAYYNEIDPFAAQWLRNLIAAGHIAPGDVDERSIIDVQASDLKGYTQCHFFAGIGGWSYALRLAGWGDDRPVWTGSCPCQPFSVAGNRKGKDDARHLWPVWFNLITERRPATVFGEQVAAAIAKGWLDSVYDDMEAQDYAIAAAILPACGVGAPHKRDRLWFVAHTGSAGRGAGCVRKQRNNGKQIVTRGSIIAAESSQAPAFVADTAGSGLEGQRKVASGVSEEQPNTCHFGGWKSEPCMGRVAHGISGRVGKLRAYGNAIVPQVAAEFIKAAMSNQIEDGK